MAKKVKAIEQESKFKNNTKFKIKKEQLVEISAKAGQERNFSEEVDLLESLGGYEFLEKELHTDLQNGLKCDDQVEDPTWTPEQKEKMKHQPGQISDYEERDYVFENNTVPVDPPKSFCYLLYEALNDFTLKILMVAASLQIVVGTIVAPEHERSYAWLDGFGILIAVFICSMVTATNDYEKQKQFEILNNVAEERKIVTVIRNGQEWNIHQEQVMVGDIVKLSEGMEIPADGIVFKSADLTADESPMTGETDPIKKNILAVAIQERDKIIQEGGRNTAGKHDVPSPLIMSGTRILTGEGTMIVIVVGDSSCLGVIKKLLRDKEDPDTPLQIKLKTIAEDIGYFGLYSACLILFVLLLRFTIERVYKNEFTGEHVNELIHYFIICIIVVVVAIPEGLPLAVTLSLAFSVKRMLTDNNLVRKLQACETMGGSNNICSDKTGTLTKNEMTLVRWWNGETIQFEDIPKYDLNNYMSEGFKEIFLLSTAINCSATMHPEEKGSKTETAILKFLMKTDHDYRQIRKDTEEVRKFPFSSARKRMSTIVNINGKNILLVKGASEMVLRACNKWRNKMTNDISNLDQGQLQTINDAIFAMASDALRTICVAYKELDGSEDLEAKDQLGIYDIETKDLTMLGIFGIADIIRPEVPGAVAACKKAGITVRMVTGDNKDTARAIAIQCGIIDPNNKNDLVIEGTEFIELTGGVVCRKCRKFDCPCPRDANKAKELEIPQRVDVIKNGEAFDKIWPHLCVMARSRPQDKYALVTGLIERGQVVAVTGDGTNDAPALKKADVGFSMGIAGTEVARDASDIVLQDDNFNSIVKAVLWGRNIYDSIRKFLQFQLTVNVVAVAVTLITAAVIKQEVLTPIQMLWVNLIMDTFASLALATEPPSVELLDRKPHNRNEYIMSKKMAKHVIGQSTLQLIIVIVLVFTGHTWIPEWESQKFDDELQDKYNDYKDNLDGKGDKLLANQLRDGPIRYFQKYPWKYMYQTEDRDTVVNGSLLSLDGLHEEYYNVYEIFRVPSRHFTIVFNTFVLLQVTNFLNARKLRDEINVFDKITKNIFFPLIVGLIIVMQFIVVLFGGKIFACFSYWGLNVQQWLICIGFSLLSNIWSLVLKQIPEEKIFNCKVFDVKWQEERAKEEQRKKLQKQLDEEAQASKNNRQGGADVENNNNNKERDIVQNKPQQQNVNESYAKQAPEEIGQQQQNNEELLYNENN